MRGAAVVVGPIPEWNAGAIEDVTVEGVVIELSYMSMTVAGTLIETEVTGRDNAICTDVWAGGGIS